MLFRVNTKTRRNHQRYHIGKVFFKFSQIHRKLLALKSLFKKVLGCCPVTLLNRDFMTKVCCKFAEILRTPPLQYNSGRLLLKNFVFNSLMLLTGYLIRRTFLHCIVVSFSIQYIKKKKKKKKKTADEISISRVCKINLQRSVISRHRINH